MALALGALTVGGPAQAQNVSETKTVGAYKINLKLLPVEEFSGTDADMIWDGGAKPNLLLGPVHPNHHLVAFIFKDGQPVEKANVSIRYRELTPRRTGWKTLPVARMHIFLKGLDTTHYGNNVAFNPGKYDVHVRVNDGPLADFHFTLIRG